MSIDQEVREKQLALEKGIIAWEKMKAEIAELNAMKSNLVKDLNIQLTEARGQREKIIAEAKVEAQSITDEASKIRLEAISFSDKTKQEASDLLHIAKAGIEELKQAQEALRQEKDQFLADKGNTEARLNAKNEALSSLDIELKARQACLDSLERANMDNEAKIKDKLVALQAREDGVVAQENDLKARVDAFNSKYAEYLREKAVIDAQNELNIQVVADIKAKTDKLSADTIANQKLMADVAKQTAQNEEQKLMINKQFDLLEKNRKELEEKSISLDERTQLLVIKDRDIENKIKILQEIRLKNGVA